MSEAVDALNEIERKVLAVLVEETDPPEHYIYFRTIERHTGLSRDWVRCACRSLTDRGLAVYSRALWLEDGPPAGSGYAATKLGVSAFVNSPHIPASGDR